MVNWKSSWEAKFADEAIRYRLPAYYEPEVLESESAKIGELLGFLDLTQEKTKDELTYAEEVSARTSI